MPSPPKVIIEVRQINCCSKPFPFCRDDKAAGIGNLQSLAFQAEMQARMARMRWAEDDAMVAFPTILVLGVCLALNEEGGTMFFDFHLRFGLTILRKWQSRNRCWIGKGSHYIQGTSSPLQSDAGPRQMVKDEAEDIGGMCSRVHRLGKTQCQRHSN